MGRSLLKLTNYNLNQMKVAVGEGLEPSRSSYVFSKAEYFLNLRHRDKEVCLPNFTTLQCVNNLFIDCLIQI